MKPDYKIDRKDLDKLIPNQEKRPKITKEHLDVLKGQLPSRRIMRKVLNRRGQSFSQKLYENFRKQRIEDNGSRR